MPSVNRDAARLDLVHVDNDDLSVSFTVTENGIAYVTTGATIVAAITTADGTTTGVSFADSWNSNTLTLSLSDAVALAPGSYRYTVIVTKSGLTRTWLGGELRRVSAQRAGSLNSSSGSTTLEINGSTTISLAITAGSGIGGVRIEDEGTSTVAAATAINFAGAGVVVTDAGSNEALVTIAGGGGPGGGATILDELDDVVITAAASGDILRFNGTDWVDTPGTTHFDAAGSAAAAQAASQPLDADLTALAAANNSSVLAATTASFTTADETKLDGVEALADVTDAANVNAAGAVMESDYDAHTILAATSDNTPAALTVAEQRVVGRITGGNITGLTAAQIRTLINVEDGATADMSAAEILAALLTVDGAGSGLDADLLDGSSSAAFQPVDSDLTAIAALTTTSYGRAFLELANQAATMALLSASSTTASGIVELATNAETITGTDAVRAVTPAGAAAAYQPLDSDLTAIAALTTTSFGRGLLALADAAALRSAASLGTMATETATDYVAKALFDANTVLAANSDNTPAAVTIAEQRIVGRVTGGNITALTGAQVASVLSGADTGGMTLEDVGAVEYRTNTVATSGSTETLDLAVYSVHDVTMDQNCTFTFSNPAPSGETTMFILILRGAFTPTFPGSVDWGDATPPTYSTPTVYSFLTKDAGTTYLGASHGKAFG